VARPIDTPVADAGLTRRVVLGRAAGGAALVAGLGLPRWARPARAAELLAAHRLRGPDSLPFPHLPAGTATMHEIQHIVVLMMENHSFDNLLGMVPHQVPGRETVDGLTLRDGRAANFNRNAAGHRIFATPASSPCQLPAVPTQAWNASHQSWDSGRNDGFVRASGPEAMRYWDSSDLPVTYSLAEHFPLGERYFCSVLAQTYPNRRFFFTGTASGTTATDNLTFSTPAANGSIFNRLTDNRIGWVNYYQDSPSPAIVPQFGTGAPPTAFRKMDQLYVDAAAGKLPPFTFLDPNYTTTSEENPQDIQLGERLIAEVVHALTHAPTWKHTALFITYDEHGGYYDHVPPPRAIRPDGIAPIQEASQPKLVPGSYDRYGFRVPLLVVSPWARKDYVSRVVQDHTSITAFIERKWNLPAMTFRDANAHPMTDYFDFRHPAFAEPPHLHAKPGLAHGLAECHRAGLHPPITPQPGTESDISRALSRFS
jgi:phospholipase C